MSIADDLRPALGLPAIQTLAAPDMAAVDALIRRRLSSDVVLINQIADHIISAGGKRLRPMLVMLAGHAAGGSGAEHHQLAAIIEFIHTSTLLHDDVVDESDLRRGRSTANALWGNAPSVLVGDFLYSRSFQLMVELNRMAVMQILADTTNRIAEGEVLQLLHVHNPDTDEAAYLRVIERKTAVLFAAGTRLAHWPAARARPCSSSCTTTAWRWATPSRLPTTCWTTRPTPRNWARTLATTSPKARPRCR